MRRKLILQIETLLLSAAFVTAGAKTVGAQQAIMQEEEAAQPATEQAEPQLTAESPEDFASVTASEPTVITTEESASTTAGEPTVITEEPASAPAGEPTAITEEPTSTTASEPSVITEESASTTAGDLTAITEAPTSTTLGDPTGTSESAKSLESPKSQESPAQDKTLASVSLKLAQELQTVPPTFLDCLKDLEVYTVSLVYSDGTEELLDKEDSRYTLSVEYEDETDTEDMDAVRRTYHATVKETATGKEYEDTQNVIFGSQPPSEIKTTEITTLTLEKEKKWLVVQSTPDVTGRYILNSDKAIKNIYYATEPGEVVCTEDILNLPQGLSYTFLIVLN